MMTNGMVDEGVEIYRNTRSRYDGEARNPYDESEYGRHYTRPMASWAAIPVLSGFRFDARSRSLALLPRINQSNFQCFWSTPTAWGTFQVTANSVTLAPAAGSLSLNQLIIPSSFARALHNLKTVLNGKAIAHTASAGPDGIVLQFASANEVDPGNVLRVQA
jgi:hypothetical protein